MTEAPDTSVVTPSRLISLEKRSAALFKLEFETSAARTDRLFAWLMGLQWFVGVALAVFGSSSGADAESRALTAAVLGAVLSGASVGLAILHPGRMFTRHVISMAQILWSALLIYLAGGRIDAHFHVFGSLAVIAFYGDIGALIVPSSLFVIAYGIQSLFFPAVPVTSVDSATRALARFAEYALWLSFTNGVLVLSIQTALKGKRELAQRQAELELTNASVELLVEERTRELEASREQYRSLVETTHAVASEIDPETLHIKYVGPQVERILGFTPEECLGDRYGQLIHPDDVAGLVAAGQKVASEGVPLQTEYRARTKAGKWLWIRTSMSLAKDRVGRTLIRSMNLDVTSEKHLEIELRQSQKLESVGRLAAGVAHEINTPIQFVSDSTHFVKDALADLTGLVERYRALGEVLAASGRITEAEAEALANAESEADLAYLLENVPQALERALDGLSRVTAIVRSMKEFAHPDVQERSRIDLNRAIESTLTIARNEYKYVADVTTEFGKLPFVPCFAGEINQVVLNLIVNAAHAIGDVVKDSGEKGRITVRTRTEGAFAVIEVGDTGTGIPESARASIFDPFFTTKGVGKGTGQGLAIARSVIVDKHGGVIHFETEIGKGTRFLVSIPLDPDGDAMSVRAA